MVSTRDEDKTSVDLGLDLLEESTRTSSQVAIAPPAAADIEPHQVEDEVKSAEILAAEGLMEDAKRKLRAILRVDPASVQARSALNRLQKQELEKILSDLKSSTPAGTRSLSASVLTQVPSAQDAGAVLEALEDEFNLSEHTDELSVLGEHNGLQEFLQGLDRDLARASDRDRIDLGIGFLEMGMPRVALHLFERASGERELALGLRAEALVRANRPLDAVVVLEEGLHDAEISTEYKCDYLYWMGRAQEKLGQPTAALAAYSKVIGLAPMYRDVRDRVRRIEGVRG